jgi:hypothetical protein
MISKFVIVSGVIANLLMPVVCLKYSNSGAVISGVDTETKFIARGGSNSKGPVEQLVPFVD